MNRDLRLDGLKFIMIFLVVLGHLRFIDYGIGIGKMIYSFHMPVFVFLSGYFTSQKTDKEKQAKWLKRMLLIYVIAQFAHFILGLALGYFQATVKNEAFDTDLLSWNVLISPFLALWYLVCLIYWRLSVWRFFPKTSDINLLSISIVLAIVSGLIPIDHDFAFQRAFSFFPFFVIGLIFKKRNLMPTLNRTPIISAWVVLLLGLLIARYLPTYLPKFHYTCWQDVVYRIVQTVLGMVLCLSVLRISQINVTEKLAKYGIYTLWIYIGHTYLIIIGQTLFPLYGIKLNLISASILACIYCVFFILLARLYHSHKEKTPTVSL